MIFIQFILMFIRLLIETVLNVIGLFNMTNWKRVRKDSKKKIAFQTYSIHLAQFFQPVVTRLLNENVELSFIILLHPQFPLSSTRELRVYARDVLHIPEKNIQLYWRTIWEKFDLIIYNDVYAKFPIRKTN